jgi:hypothetical protein
MKKPNKKLVSRLSGENSIPTDQPLWKEETPKEGFYTPISKNLIKYSPDYLSLAEVLGLYDEEVHEEYVDNPYIDLLLEMVDTEYTHSAMLKHIQQLKQEIRTYKEIIADKY